jgi:hypothetical protein
MDIRKFIDKVKNFDSSKKTYKQIGARSLMEGFELNEFSIDIDNDPDAQTFYIQPNVESDYIEPNVESEVNEEISYEFKHKGGIIVFSVNVNAVKLSKNKLVRFIKNQFETATNILFKTDKINKVIKNNPKILGVTIGNFVRGRYRADDGSLYNETSLSVEIFGITSDVLNKTAEELAQEFKQETVLVKNYHENKIYLVKP